MIAVCVDTVHKSFPGTRALAGCSLTLETGECHGVVGENGAGKSTLMKILAGADRADSGAVELFGQPAQFTDPRQARAAGVSAIYQELELVPELTIAENIFLGREPRRGGGLIDRARLRNDAAQRMRELGHDVDPAARVAPLNLAEKQLVEIARALAADARVFLMDEPTAALGDRDRERLFEVIRRLKAAGAAVAFISHRLEEVLEICDRVTVLRDGKDVLSARAADLTKDQLITAMAGRALAVAKALAGAVPGDVLLEVRHLATAAGVRDISFALHAGEIVVATGLAGSGRTRLLRALYGVDAITAGELLFLGQPFRALSPSEAARAGLGFLGEDRRLDGLLPERSVRENISLPSLRRFARPLLNRRREIDAVAEHAFTVGVRAPSMETPARLLSGGNQQKSLLARWLMAGARVLLLDEPTRGVDINAKNEIYRLLRRQADAGMAILATTSELPEALLLADRLLVMRDGRIAGVLDRGEATAESVLRLAVGEPQ